MHSLLYSSSLRTLNASEASWFYVPFYHKCISTVLRKNASAITEFYDLAFRAVISRCACVLLRALMRDVA